MAATPVHLIKRACKALGAILAGIVLALIAFVIAGWIGSSIPRNSGWQEPRDGVEILVESNGVHTALVLPLFAPEKNWWTVFPVSDVALHERPYTHVSISWGEREVFLNTPTWWDLSPMTVARIVGVGGEGLIHVAYYVDPAPSDDLRPLTISRQQYRRLVASIEKTLPTAPLISHPGYGNQDVFYDAPGTYTPSNTCNQWTSDRLAAADVRVGWWTPFAGGVMKWIAAPDRS